jgi:hypothetical protein
MKGTVAHLDQLREIHEIKRVQIIEAISARNAHFFDDEMGKLEKWADDLKSGLEYELKEMDREIKIMKTESKKILQLEEKLKIQKEIKVMEKERNNKRRNLLEAQDNVDTRKEELITVGEARVKQKMNENKLFTVKWRVV